MAADPATTPGRLRKRADFVAVSKGRRAGARAFLVQCAHRDSDGGPARFGLTVTRKVGTAVERNRIRRRLRTAIAQAAGQAAGASDYVIVARREALIIPFEKLVGDLCHAIARVSAPREPRSGPRPAGS
jgi:ribonuclease P protein component